MVHKRRVRLGKDAKDRSGLEPKEGVEEASGDEAAAVEKPKVAECAAVSQADREKATQKAIAAIKQGLKDNPKAQDDGTPFLLAGWSKDFKPALGSYRKFVERSSAFVVQQGEKDHKYTIRIQDGKAPVQAASKKEWELRLSQSWKSYIQGVQQEARNPKDFVEFARELAYQSSRQQLKRQKKENKANAGDEAGDDEAPKKKSKLEAQPKLQHPKQ